MSEGAAFRDRWASVNAFQNAELGHLTVDERFDQLLQLYELRDVVREDPRAEEELMVVRRRWAELRRRYLARR